MKNKKIILSFTLGIVTILVPEPTLHGMNRNTQPAPASNGTTRRVHDNGTAPTSQEEDISAIWARIQEQEKRQSSKRNQQVDIRQLLAQADKDRRQRAEAPRLGQNTQHKGLQNPQGKVSGDKDISVIWAQIEEQERLQKKEDTKEAQLESDLALAEELLTQESLQQDQEKQSTGSASSTPQGSSTSSDNDSTSSTDSHSDPDKPEEPKPTKEVAIDTMINKHLTKSLPNFPAKTISVNIPKTKDTITVLPSLQQTIIEGDGKENTTNYCGYYALWNARCFCLAAGEEARRDRKQFAESLKRMLDQIHTARTAEDSSFESMAISGRYGQLSRDEIRKLINEELPQTIILELQSIFAPCLLDWSHEDAFEDVDPKAYFLTLSFFTGCIDEITIILATSADSGHYLTIHVKRKAGKLEFYVADSLSGTAQNPEILMNRILPIYYFLTGQYDLLTKELAAKCHFRIDTSKPDNEKKS